MTNSIYDITIEAIQERTGLEKDDITLDALLEDDLGINMISDFPAIIKKINKQLDIKMPLQDQDFIDELKECETVAELVDLIEDSEM